VAIDLDDPIALMLAASVALTRAGIEAAAYGGLTLGMYGEVRETRDADLAAAGVNAEVARRGLEEIGVLVVTAFADIQFGGCMLTRLSLVGGGQLNTVDLVTPRSPRYAAAMLSRAVSGSLRGQELRVVSPEDFVILKTLATRDRDLEDARSVLEKQRGRIDETLIEQEIAALSAEITDHDILGRFAKLEA
jgi:Nucleotidyl transferase of unknown function (DUF2204)